MQNHFYMDHKNIKLKTTKKFGKGVFATGLIRKGEVVAEFDGTIYDNQFKGWNEDLLNHTIQFGKNLWRDSKGLARYLNHSCEPNCGIKDYFRVVAMRDIIKGEQITWDYEMTEKSWWWRMQCLCGHGSCRKRIGNFRNMPLSVRRKYKGYISPWLLESSRLNS